MQGREGGYREIRGAHENDRMIWVRHGLGLVFDYFFHSPGVHLSLKRADVIDEQPAIQMVDFMLQDDG